MSSKTEFERQLMALDQNKLWDMMKAAIVMSRDYHERYGHDPDTAIAAAILEVLGGVEAMIELDDHGEL